MSEFRVVPKEGPKKSALLPVMGLFMALCSGVVAVFAAPTITDLLMNNSADFKTRIKASPRLEEKVFEFIDRDFDLIHVVIAVLLWFIMMALFVMIVSAVAGSDTVVEKEGKTVRPRKSELTPREVKKYNEKMEKQRMDKIKALERMKAKAEAEARRQRNKKPSE